LREKQRNPGNKQRKSADQPKSLTNITGNLADKGRKAAKIPQSVAFLRMSDGNYGIKNCLLPKLKPDSVENSQDFWGADPHA